MSNLLMLGICLLAGGLLRRSGRVADGAHSVLNAVIIHLALPAVTLRWWAASATPRSSVCR